MSILCSCKILALIMRETTDRAKNFHIFLPYLLLINQVLWVYIDKIWFRCHLKLNGANGFSIFQLSFAYPMHAIHDLPIGTQQNRVTQISSLNNFYMLNNIRACWFFFAKLIPITLIKLFNLIDFNRYCF